MIGKIMTVLGEISPDSLNITDAHNHVWIEPVPGSVSTAPVLNNQGDILAELEAYSRAGGSAIIDCQPGGCGRDGLKLSELSRQSGVAIVASTGYHRPIYYPSDFWLWGASADKIADHLIIEISDGLEETQGLAFPVRAGVIKIACEETLEKAYRPALEGAANAVLETGLSLEIHTEKGGDAESIFAFFIQHGLKPQHIILCHMDKRPDFGLHRDLAQAGLMLEYDTFYRPKYQPEIYLWPLIVWMVEAGLEHQIALATDMAESNLWRNLGAGPGLANFPTSIRQRLMETGLSDVNVKNLMGTNINRRLAGLS